MIAAFLFTGPWQGRLVWWRSWETSSSIPRMPCPLPREDASGGGFHGHGPGSGLGGRAAKSFGHSKDAAMVVAQPSDDVAEAMSTATRCAVDAKPVLPVRVKRAEDQFSESNPNIVPADPLSVRAIDCARCGARALDVFSGSQLSKGDRDRKSVV